MSSKFKEHMLSIHQQKGFASKTVLASLFVGGLVVSAWIMLGASFSSDPDLIGKGKPAVVIMYDGGDSVSANLKYGYKKVREEYKDSVEFLLINTLSPNGLAFLQHTPALAGTALYYNAAGEKLKVLQGPKDVEYLGASIKKTFGI